ncbi:MAG: tetratricopeptide repeat protein [Chitinophagales bacterium]
MFVLLLLLLPFHRADTARWHQKVDYYQQLQLADSALLYADSMDMALQSSAWRLRRALLHLDLRHFPEVDSLLRSDSSLLWHEGRLPATFAMHEAPICKEICDTLIARQPNHFMAHYFLGLLLRQQGDWAAAKAHFDQCLEQMPAYPPLLEYLAEIAVFQKQYALALQRYTAAGHENLQHAASFNNIGICYYQLRDYQKAIQYFHLALDSNWQMGEGYFNRGLAYYHQQHFDSASMNWLAAAASWDSCQVDTCRYYYKDALFSLAHCYMKTGQPEKALYYFEWLQQRGYSTDLSREIRNLKWTIFLSRKWYLLTAAAIFFVMALVFLGIYFKRSK